MNYRVMKRPMFKMGGKANSQGTGITSGLDEKVNLAIGGGVIKGDNVGMRENFKDPQLKPRADMSIEELLNQQQMGIDKRLAGLDTMKDLVRLQAIGNLAGNVLPNIESGGLRAVTDFFKDPMTTQTAISGLTGLKKVDLQEGKIRGEGLDKYIKGRIASKNLDIAEQRALVQTATQLKLKAGEDSRALLTEYGSVANMPNAVKKEYYDLRTVIGDLSPSKAQQLAVNQIEKQNAENAESGLGRIYKRGTPEYIEAVRLLTEEYLRDFTFDVSGNAYGGTPNRVERQVGSPMGGEQPLPEDPTKPVNPFQPKPIGPFPSKAEKMDADMETKGEGNNVYAMLRQRLPQEITDDVVKLIAYNKEAFADFASIKNQEDVNSFNEKYGVELVIDVATV